jgi:hypothetical protein
MIWYLPDPTHWILCEIVSDILGRVTVRTYLGEMVSGLKKRTVGESLLVEKRSTI